MAMPDSPDALADSTDGTDPNWSPGVRQKRARALDGELTMLPPTVASLQAMSRFPTAADALGAIGPAASSSVRALMAALRDPDRHVRICAAGALGRIGEAAREAVPALRSASSESALRAEATVPGKEAREDWFRSCPCPCPCPIFFVGKLTPCNTP